MTDPGQIAEERALGFVLLEGVSRLIRDFRAGGGCGLIRYLRPLTQVLAMQPLDEGGAADRCVVGYIWMGWIRCPTFKIGH